MGRVRRSGGGGNGERGPARRRCHDDRRRRARPAAAASAVVWMIEYAVLLGVALKLVAVDGALRATHNGLYEYVVRSSFYPSN